MSAQSVLTRRSARSTAVSRGGADRAGIVRILGTVGVGAGLLFGAMSVWQHAAALDTDGGGAGVAVNQTGFALAMAGYLALGVGLFLARPGGDGRTARVFPALVAGAWAALLVGIVIESLTSLGEDAIVLLPIGGAAQVVGLAGLGITTVMARRWSGWRRFWALGFAVFFIGALFVPAVAGAEPGVITEVLWALGYSGLGAALVSEHSAGRGSGRTRVLVGVAVVALLGSAVVVAATSGADAAPTTNVPVVEDRPIVGSADVLERQAEKESAARHGSADALERQAESD